MGADGPDVAAAAERQPAQAAALGTLIILLVLPVIFVLRRQLCPARGSSEMLTVRGLTRPSSPPMAASRR